MSTRLGGAGDTVYAGTAARGLLASNDGGASWEARNAEAGKMFMGVILVDPADPQRLIAPDMSAGLMASADGGVTWKPLGGPGGAMAAAWDPTNTQRLLAVGMAESALSNDGGKTWTPLTLPEGAAAATFSPDGTNDLCRSAQRNHRCRLRQHRPGTDLEGPELSPDRATMRPLLPRLLTQPGLCPLGAWRRIPQDRRCVQDGRICANCTRADALPGTPCSAGIQG